MAKFGWCMDNLHDKCWVTNNEFSCSCECHAQPGDKPVSKPRQRKRKSPTLKK